MACNPKSLVLSTYIVHVIITAVKLEKKKQLSISWVVVEQVRGYEVIKLLYGIWFTAPDWSVQKLIVQIVLGPLSCF